MSTPGKKDAPYFFVFYFLITLYPGIIFISSFFNLADSWLMVSILIAVVVTVISVYPYVTIRTLVRLQDRNLTLGIVVGFVEGFNSLMTGIFMKVINPESKIVQYFNSTILTEDDFIGYSELQRVPVVLRWIAVYALITMALGIVLVKLKVTGEHALNPLWHLWLKTEVTNQ